MQKTPLKRYFVGLGLLAFSLFSLAHNTKSKDSAKTINFPQVEPNVPYSKVAQLAFTQYDQKITYGEDPLQFGLYWQAKKTDKNNPLIVLIHGGCWLNAFDIKHTYPLATALAQDGYNVWSLEYRRTGDEGGGWPGTYNDILAGIKHLQKVKLNSNQNIVLAGHSAGGHLALLAAAELNKNPLDNINLKGTYGLAAISDIAQYAKGGNSCQSATKGFMQGMPEDKPDAYAKANPVNYAMPSNTWLLQGDADGIVPMSHRLLKNTENKLIAKAGHFDWVHPGSEAYSVLLKTLKVVNNGH